MIKELKEKYSKRLSEINYKENCMTSADLWLFSKFAYRVPKGWYGFALGKDVPIIWAQILEEYLHYLEKKCPYFEIHQIKLKFGGLRFYVELNTDDEELKKELHAEFLELEDWLFHSDLIY